MPRESFEISGILAAALSTRRLELFRGWRGTLLKELRERCADQEVIDNVEGGLRAFEDVMISYWKAERDLEEVRLTLGPLADNLRGVATRVSAVEDALESTKGSTRPFHVEYEDHRRSREEEER